MEVMWAQSL